MHLESRSDPQLQQFAARLRDRAGLMDCTVEWTSPLTLRLQEGKDFRFYCILGCQGGGLPTVVFRVPIDNHSKHIDAVIGEAGPGGTIFEAIYQFLPLTIDWRIEVKTREGVVVAPAELGRALVGYALLQSSTKRSHAAGIGSRSDRQLHSVAVSMVGLATTPSQNQKIAIENQVGDLLAEPFRDGQLVSIGDFGGIENRICAVGDGLIAVRLALEDEIEL
jgi:hypothetical protein